MTTFGAKFQKGLTELSFFERRSRIPSASFTPNAISSHWGTIGMLGELVLILIYINNYYINIYINYDIYTISGRCATTPQHLNKLEIEIAVFTSAVEHKDFDRFCVNMPVHWREEERKSAESCRRERYLVHQSVLPEPEDHHEASIPCAERREEVLQRDMAERSSQRGLVWKVG